MEWRAPMPWSCSSLNIQLVSLTMETLVWCNWGFLDLRNMKCPLYNSITSHLSPPHLPVKPLPVEELKLQSGAVRFNQHWDVAWLSQIYENDKPIEWAGFNAQQDQLEEHPAKKAKTLVVFGPVTDSPPAHPDTILTTLAYLESDLRTFGIQYIHLTVNLQLYETAGLVQWNDPQRWTNLILHSGMMHTFKSFLGCIGMLMKGSGVKVLMSSASGGITSILNGKAWTNTLWAYCLKTAVLLKTLNDTKAHHEFSEYLEIAR